MGRGQNEKGQIMPKDTITIAGVEIPVDPEDRTEREQGLAEGYSAGCEKGWQYGHDKGFKDGWNAKEKQVVDIIKSTK